MSTTKTRILHSFSLVLNILNFALVAYAISMFFTGVVDNTNMDVVGKYCFRYFTNLSNILCAIISLIVIPWNIKAIAKGEDSEPKWLHILKFLSTTGVTLTFLTVVFFLGPTQGYDIMFAGPCLYLHALCPIFAIISFVLCELKNDMKFVESLYGLIPMLLYAIVYIAMVLITEKWPDFYGFKTVIPWYVSIIVMPIATFAISAGLFGLRKLAIKFIRK